MSGWTFTRWWRVVVTATGQLWCETSNEEEAREALQSCPDPARLERHQVRSENRWVAA